MPDTKTWDGKSKITYEDAAAAKRWLVKQGVPQSYVDRVSEPGAGYDGDIGAYWRDILTTYKSNQTPAQPVKPADTKPKGQPATGSAVKADVNRDGEVSPQEANVYAAGGGNAADLINSGPGSFANADKVPLWGYELGQVDPNSLTVENKSWGGRATPGAKPGQRIGARYFEADTLGPLKWSEEKRADLQRQLFNLGLYGDNQIRLGTWGAADQAALAELLTAANMEGRTWEDQLAYWKMVPPTELLATIKGGNNKPTIQVTNPTDIRAAAQQTSQSLTGRIDRQFVDQSVAGYQQQETAAQQGVTSDQMGGGGGTVTQAPSLGGYLDDRLRREQPLEVDGYQFLNAFATLQQMIGAV